MKNIKKLILVTSSIFVILLICVFFLGMGETSVKVDEYKAVDGQGLGISSEGTSSNDEETGSENPEMPYTFDEWREFLLNIYNMTLEDLNTLDEQSSQSLDQEARIYQGWANGTYTDEEKDQLFLDLHSTPLITPPLLDQFSDDYFKASFTVTNNFLNYEHVFRVYAYIDYNKEDTNPAGGGKFYDGYTEKIRGPFEWCLPPNDHPYTVVPFHSSLDPKESFMGWERRKWWIHEQQIPIIGTYNFECNNPLEWFQSPGPVYIVIQVLWVHDTFDVWEEGLFGIPFWNPCKYYRHFYWETVVYEYDLLLREMKIYDDDTNAPVIPTDSVVNPWFNPIELPPYIYDSDPTFQVEVCAYDLGEGLANFIDFGSQRVTGGIKFDTELIMIDPYTMTELWSDWYRYVVPNVYAPGTYNTMIKVWENDDDGWIGDRLSASQYLTFTVYDDDISAPIVNPINDWEIFDSEEFLEIILDATDQSGIASVYATFMGEDYEYDHINTEGKYVILVPNPNILGTHIVDIHVWDADADGWAGDSLEFSESYSFTVVDDDDTPPIVNPLNDWEIYDSESNLKIVLQISDISGIYRVYATFNGVDYEYDHIDVDGNYVILIPNPLTPDIYSVDVWVWDNDNDRPGDRKAFSQSFDFNVVDDDTTPPEFELFSTMEWSGEEILFRFMIDATDDSGINFIAIGFAETPFMGAGWHEIILPSGFYTMYVNVTDADNDRPHDSEYHFEIYTIILDLTPPITEISYDIGYFDGETIYVVSGTKFSLSATDDISGVAHTAYSINGDPWVTYMGPFSLEELEGPNTIEFFSEDNVGNVETVNIMNVQIVSIDMNSYITKGESDIIEDFDVIFRKCKKDGIEGFMLVATNPGQIFYNIEIINGWPITINTLVVDVILPFDFLTQGSTPIHVYLDSLQITGSCVFDGNTITIQDVAPGSIVQIRVHVDYGLKGTFYETIDDFWMEQYIFSSEIQANSDSLIGTYSSSTEFKAFEKKTTAIAGFVKDMFGNPIPFATIELFLEDGTTLTAEADADGFYYFLELPAGIHQIRVFSLTDWQAIEVWKDEISWWDFVIP